MKLIDDDNMVAVELTDSDAAKLKSIVDASSGIDDGCGGFLSWEDALDLHGDLCVGEDAYDSFKGMLGITAMERGV